MNSLMKIFIVVLFICLMSFGSVTQAHILDGAKEWNGHYYKIFRMKMNWNKSYNFCKSVGGHLATAETQEENEMLKQMFNEANIQHCWMGARRDNQNIWRWISGKMISDYFDWAPDQPSRGKDINGDDFSVFFMTRDYKGKWYTFVERAECEFMCEWEKAEDAHESTL